MTGFIRGLFSKSKPDETSKSASVERPKQEKVERPKKEKPVRQPKENDAYFLGAPEAQTFGNLEYMQTSRKTRRTFPKTAGSSEILEYIQETSSMGRMIAGQSQANSTPKVETQPAQASSTDSGAAQRRKAGSDMDMFRKMAKDMRK
ncbi:MAG TPA: hypothetical protein VL134_00950 [Leptolyngbya sp.]|jgi:hypothetical protein|nr:hypothetical protein [Leptolyngbya sp.]